MQVDARTLGSSNCQTVLDLFGGADARGLYEQGMRAAVIVENQYGRWFFLNAESLEHAKNIARDWVFNLKARGASIRFLKADGSLSRVKYSIFEQPQYGGELR